MSNYSFEQTKKAHATRRKNTVPLKIGDGAVTFFVPPELCDYNPRHVPSLLGPVTFEGDSIHICAPGHHDAGFYRGWLADPDGVIEVGYEDGWYYYSIEPFRI
jgi:hypothetical protein